MSKARQLLGIALLACNLLVLVRLALVAVPWQWVCTFALPAAGLAIWRRRARPFWQLALFVLLVQGGSLLWALLTAPPPSRPAALACTILPSLAYVSLRRRDHDVALGLFLCFCVLLIGDILGGSNAAALVAFGALALLILRIESQLQALQQSASFSSPLPRLPLLGPAWQLFLPCFLLFVLLERSLGAIPGPHRELAATTAEQATAAPVAEIGLSDSFVLDGIGDVLGNLRGEQLLGARHADGSPLPNDFYLRSGFFAVPGLDRWQTGSLSLQRVREDPIELTAPNDDNNVQWLEIERYAAARNLVLLPPGSRLLRFLPGLRIDREREWLRQDKEWLLQDGNGTRDDYEVGYEIIRGMPQRVEMSWAQRGLLDLPPDLDIPRFRELLRRWDATGSPQRIAAQIAKGLAGHCRYMLHEPVGPYQQALMNFLFAAEDRHGYCMHFASAAALLLRLSGIPCRIGVGLYGGQADRRDPSLRIFGSQHAHAWVEIPWQGMGFQVFDPTPAADRGAQPRNTEPAAVATTPAAAEDTNWLDSLRDRLAQPWAALGLLCLLLLSWRRSSKPTGRDNLVPSPEIRSARRLLGNLLRELAQAGCPRTRGQTLEQHLQRIATLDLPVEAVHQAYMAYQEVRFGGREFDATREQLLRTAIANTAERRASRHYS